MTNKNESLEPDSFYHIYNRANGNEKLFLTNENYRFFMQQFVLYTYDYIEVYCYCLLPNHFHFVVKVKSEREIMKVKKTAFTDSKKIDFSKLVGKQFSNFFSSYTQAFNKEQKRMGSLFMKNFKRKKITDVKYLLKLIHYTHFNPIEAGLAINLEDWKFSSYKTILSSKKTRVKRKEVLELFHDKFNFIAFHKQNPSFESTIE